MHQTEGFVDRVVDAFNETVVGARNVAHKAIYKTTQATSSIPNNISARVKKRYEDFYRMKKDQAEARIAAIRKAIASGKKERIELALSKTSRTDVERIFSLQSFKVADVELKDLPRLLRDEAQDVQDDEEPLTSRFADARDAALDEYDKVVAEAKESMAKV